MSDGREAPFAQAGVAAEVGGKAAALAALADAGLLVPRWFVVRADADLEDAAVAEELTRRVREMSPAGELLAVRSSGIEEDGAEHSFAGQFDSFLYVAPEDVPSRIRDVWTGAASERVTAYRRERGLSGDAPRPAVIVQRMLDPVAAGVAFSADPVSGRRGVCVIGATWGVGASLVSGEGDADTFHVDRDNRIVHRQVADKRTAQRGGAGGIVTVPVAAPVATQPALADAEVVAVARMARAAERHAGAPQDIEWAIANDVLYLLQSRPITSLAALPDPDGELAIWDNSNIAESFGGVTTPLTFSFARYVYEHVYREFCRILKVSEARIEANTDALRAMLGLVRGRVYYNLVSWYRVLALLPGYRVNRAFMEQMMGVKEGLPPEVAARIAPPGWRERVADLLALTRSALALLREQRGIERSIGTFQARLNDSLGSGRDLSVLRPDELVAQYRSLERALLLHWDAPLVNDFLAMIFFGVLRRIATAWCGDDHGTLQNDLVSGGGDVVSAEPARRILEMAALVRADPALVTALRDGALSDVRDALARTPDLQRAFADYLAVFGDRCLEELKLETITLGDDPLLLARSIGRLASVPPPPAPEVRVDVRADAERVAAQRLAGRPLRRALFRWVRRNARNRVRDRENLRFERTRVFGRVRRIFLELGKRFTAAGALDDPRDIFYLTVDEALGWGSGATASADLRALATARKAEFDGYRTAPPPPDRFQTRGAVHVGGGLAADAVEVTVAPAGAHGEMRQGIGCYPGVIRGIARVVRDPRGATLEPGAILVAERTDPGWVMLFPAARGLLVERGSILSHSAIVARELGLPAVVSVPGLTSWLETGDEVELDGRTGTVVRLARGQGAG